MITAAYGSWRSPISADLIVQGSVGLSGVMLSGGDRYWLESRPTERGRTTLIRQSATGQIEELTPTPWNVRTRAHEYGGGSYCIDQGEVYFSHDKDQRLYRLILGQDPQPLTPELPLKFADGLIDRQRQRWIGVREDHRPEGEAIDAIVAIPLTGEPSEGQILTIGADFYASPRLSADGQRLAWLTWSHPNMPWDGTELWVAEFLADGSLATPQKVAGGDRESVFQPEWLPDGRLGFVSDRSSWWNLYSWDGQNTQAIAPTEAEFGLPQWVFGMRTWAPIDGDRWLAASTKAGHWSLSLVDLATGSLKPFDLPFTDISGLVVEGDRALFTAANTDRPGAVIELQISSGEWQVLKSSSSLDLDPRYLSIPQSISFPSANGRVAYGHFYPPNNPDYRAPAGEKPPLLVKSHGGPTAQTRSSLSLGIQYWTSRGIAVLDVDYGGSTGYGRPYRDALQGQWGIVDVEDCAAGAQWLADQGLVDGDRLCIDGGSAGGYTTLCALTFTDVFKAGASRYGIGDLKALAEDTHKFESRYLDGLIGPWPEAADLYRERSPIHHVEQLNCPVIFFQGLEDKVVPPAQAETMVAALKAKGLPVAYVLFPEEQHGFRQAANIKRSLEGELYFYSQIFGFDLADEIEPVAIANWPKA
ncbi:S9 family peptidase [Synechococcus elongatus]|uniref:Probable peptidase n=1 Tax=Synechococcus elongatus (strain ATCC 33912 / PCC 7942 / FACHB-805) TaxID=1140 RepID=Q31LI6_SYNE7|nr:S9 family peptidase [Synechococcus elongatus]ABB58083.1 probable peptidase [Synechococcus elongatus PCC 7942 = FACHB-805]AJD57440.1 peptidase [Synechococcus elongatus UTEX 2973]MBD2586802.1 S9 family peptidase [Synechococcus elongatus FACHB-242]MBD2687873.1 S9 family peptidase [Synechococcus elongatus FACHB-1061]MBD2706416.1 S9 family peptidase [Synechococcus elongatus PCC 7942 = FACHB-805]